MKLKGRKRNLNHQHAFQSLSLHFPSFPHSHQFVLIGRKMFPGPKSQCHWMLTRVTPALALPKLQTRLPMWLQAQSQGPQVLEPNFLDPLCGPVRRSSLVLITHQFLPLLPSYMALKKMSAVFSHLCGTRMFAHLLSFIIKAHVEKGAGLQLYFNMKYLTTTTIQDAVIFVCCVYRQPQKQIQHNRLKKKTT